MDLTHMLARLPQRIVVQHLQGVADLPAANWSDIPPAGGLTGMLLSIPSRGKSPKWFSATKAGRDGVSLRFKLATDAALIVARLSGAKVSWPEYLPFDKAVVLARWARDRIKESGGCTIHGSVSRMLRVAVAAHEEGIDLTGAIIRGGGEPPTPAKVAQITRTGATFRSSYAYTEVGSVGTSCLASDQPNDQHFFRDHLAMIQAPRQVPGFDIEVSAFSFTTLLGTAPKLLLNVESDDYGIVDTRPCGCPWEELGFPDHIREIPKLFASSPERASLSSGATWSGFWRKYCRLDSGALRWTISCWRKRTIAASPDLHSVALVPSCFQDAAGGGERQYPDALDGRSVGGDDGMVEYRV